jgi:hypothetical protein
MKDALKRINHSDGYQGGGEGRAAVEGPPIDSRQLSRWFVKNEEYQKLKTLAMSDDHKKKYVIEIAVFEANPHRQGDTLRLQGSDVLRLI